MKIYGFQAACVCWNWLSEYESKLFDFNSRYNFQYDKNQAALTVKFLSLQKDGTFTKHTRTFAQMTGGNFRDGMTGLWFKKQDNKTSFYTLVVPSEKILNPPKTICRSNFLLSIEFDEKVEFHLKPKRFKAIKSSFLQKDIDSRVSYLAELDQESTNIEQLINLDIVETLEADDFPNIRIKLKKNVSQSAPDATSPFFFKKGQEISIRGSISSNAQGEWTLWGNHDIGLSPIFSGEDVEVLYAPNTPKWRQKLKDASFNVVYGS